MPIRKPLFFIFAFAIISTGVSRAQNHAPRAERPRLRAAQRPGPVRIDGTLTEDAWAQAPVASRFVQGEPTEGTPPAQPTRVRVLYDEEALYVGARMIEPDPSVIREQLVRRDQGGQYDFFTVMLDPNLDRQTGYLFRVGAAGNERDAFLFDDTRVDVDFDAVWASDVHRDSIGWSVELRLPLSQIQYVSSDSTQTWGLNFKRRRVASNSISWFSLVSRTVEGRVSQFGFLSGLDLSTSGRYLELEPFFAPEFLRAPSDSRDPFFDGTEFNFTSAGLELSYGLSPSFTLDATFNPSFGQTEVDPAVVNLSAFETFFPEKRPFFVQEARIFDFDLVGPNQLFFSRRIGRQDLQGQPPAGADFVDVPDRNTILGASKVTGRTEGGLSVGVLTAVTQEETGKAYFLERDATVEFTAQPMVETGVVRLSQNLREGATRFGVLGTALNRELGGRRATRSLTDEAFSFGLDFEHNWGGGRTDRKWGFSGHWAGTLIRGSSEAITRVQTNPQHFFQRPDADYLSVDSSATSMFGYQGELVFGRKSAEHWTWDVFLAAVSPRFAGNDLGFNTFDERIDSGTSIQYQDVTPGDWFRQWSVDIFVLQSYRHSLVDDLLEANAWEHSLKTGLAACCA